MKLDYINNINAFGDQVVRLYDFNLSEAEKFYHQVNETLIINKVELNLGMLDFVERRNCSLTLKLSEDDLGITRINKQDFTCELTLAAYLQMLKLLEPFCKKDTKAHQWLYDVDNPIDFLFSPAGTW